MNPEPTEQASSCPAESPFSSRWADTLFVGGVWLLLVLAGLGYVARFGSDIPYMEDWEGIPFLVRTDSRVLGWFWEQCNEHRMPLGKIIAWLSWHGLGGDMRAPMYLQVLALGAAAGLLILAARRIRGTTSATDAFFPLLLLHWYHGQNFLWSGQLYYVLAVFFYGALAAYFAGGRGLRGFWSTLGASLCLAVLPLQGAMGMIFAAPLSLAMACLGVAHRRMDGPEARRRGTLMLGAVAMTWAVMGLYMVGYQQPESLPVAKAGVGRMAAATVEAVTLGLGFLGPRLWPVSGAAVTALALATLGILLHAWKTRPAERIRILTLLLAAGAGVALAGVLGIGRADSGVNALRYVILATPLLGCVFLIWCLYGSPFASRLVPLALFFVMAASLVHHMALGYYWGQSRAKAVRQLDADIAAGIPVTGLVARSPELAWGEGWMATSLELLRGQRLGRFAAIEPDPPMNPRAISPTPLAVEATLQGDAWQGGRRSKFTFPLDKPTWVYAVRIEAVLESSGKTPQSQFQILWNPIPETSQARPLREESQEMPIYFSPTRWTRTFWVNARIDRFQVLPAQEPFQWRLLKIELLERP